MLQTAVAVWEQNGIRSQASRRETIVRVKVLSRAEVEQGSAEDAYGVISIRSPDAGSEPELELALTSSASSLILSSLRQRLIHGDLREHDLISVTSQ